MIKTSIAMLMLAVMPAQKVVPGQLHYRCEGKVCVVPADELEMLLRSNANAVEAVKKCMNAA